LLMIGRLRSWMADPLGAEQALRRATECARRSGHHRVEREAGTWLLACLQDLPIPAPEMVRRAERLLESVAGDPWAEAAILQPLILLYGFAGRVPDARAAGRRAESTLAAAGAVLDQAICAKLAGRAELIAGDLAAAEQNLRRGYEALRMAGERGQRASVATWLAEVLYPQGRHSEARRLTEEAQSLGGSDDYEVQGRWRATKAKLLAREGHFPEALRLAEEAVALVPARVDAPERAEFLIALAEVCRLSGATEDARARLQEALQFYQRRQMAGPAERARALLES